MTGKPQEGINKVVPPPVPGVKITDPEALKIAIFTYSKHGANKEEVMDLLQLTPAELATHQSSFDAGFHEFRHYIRKAQIAQASMNANMAIWLGKQYLGQRDFKDTGEELQKAIDQAVGSAMGELLKEFELVPVQKRIGGKAEMKKLK